MPSGIKYDGKLPSPKAAPQSTPTPATPDMSSVPGGVPQVAAPGAQYDLTKLTPAMKGDIRGRTDQAAGQQIANISRRAGGDTSSPLFQFLASGARTGAAAAAGTEGAKLDLQAADVMGARDLARGTTNAQLTAQAQALANQQALARAGLDLQGQQLRQQGSQFDASLALQMQELAMRYGGGGAGAPDYSQPMPTQWGGPGWPHFYAG